MNTWAIIGSIMGSSVLTALVTAWFARPTTRAAANKTNIEAAGDLSEHSIGLVEALEKRVQIQDEKLGLLEKQVMIFLSAVSCAYQCAHAAECPVLEYLRRNPIYNNTNLKE